MLKVINPIEVESIAMQQVIPGASPRLLQIGVCSYDLYSARSNKSNICNRRKGISVYVQRRSSSRISQTSKGTNSLQIIDCVFHGTDDINRLESFTCNCQQVETVGGITLLEHGNGGFTSNIKSITDGPSKDTLHKVSENSIEDEAWNLLRDSIVYYCNKPIGTIAANDPSSSSILNYDQVFIRDFIPSGIAFLLKGEYDIVRNFILHTLQLQVISKSC